MKGRYAGSRMTIYGSILPGAASLAQWSYRVNALTPQARYRLKVLDWHRRRGENVSLTARRFGLDRGTVRRWAKRFRQRGVLGLNDQSRRPMRLRTPTVSPEIVVRVCALRKRYPAWSKYKIRALLVREGLTVSASTVGRVLKRRGFIDQKASRRRRRAALKPRRRFPKGLKINAPGQIVQMDTKTIVTIGGKKIYQFTAIDALTKFRVLACFPSEASRNGAAFLAMCREEFPFPILAVQTDNGSPFLKDFIRRCEELKIVQYFIHPRTPKENTYVERSHGSDEKEFYAFGNVVSDWRVMHGKLKGWQGVWNGIRPHEALGYRCPNAYLAYLKDHPLPTKDVVILQA